MPSPTPSSSASEPPREQVTLLDSTTAEVWQDKDGWSLQINGIRQSHLGSPDAPPTLAAFRWMLAALAPDLPRRCAHLGGGLLTLPRLLAARQPGSHHVVVELEPELVRLAQDRFGLPPELSLRLGDARKWIDSGGDSSNGGQFDAIVVDIFAGGRIPPAFTSREFFARAREKLRPSGKLIVNSIAGPELEFTRRELATMQAVFEHVAMIVQGSVLKGVRFGNATLIGSAEPLDADAIRGTLTGDSAYGALVTDLDPIVGGALPIGDAEQLWSPEPNLPDFDKMLKALDGVEAMRENVQQTFGKDH